MHVGAWARLDIKKLKPKTLERIVLMHVGPWTRLDIKKIKSKNFREDRLNAYRAMGPTRY